MGSKPSSSNWRYFMIKHKIKMTGVKKTSLDIFLSSKIKNLFMHQHLDMSDCKKVFLLLTLKKNQIDFDTVFQKLCISQVRRNQSIKAWGFIYFKQWLFFIISFSQKISLNGGSRFVSQIWKVRWLKVPGVAASGWWWCLWKPYDAEILKTVWKWV